MALTVQGDGLVVSLLELTEFRVRRRGSTSGGVPPSIAATVTIRYFVNLHVYAGEKRDFRAARTLTRPALAVAADRGRALGFRPLSILSSIRSIKFPASVCAYEMPRVLSIIKARDIPSINITMQSGEHGWASTPVSANIRDNVWT